MRATKGRPSSSIVGDGSLDVPISGTLPFVRLQKNFVISPYIIVATTIHELVRYTIEGKPNERMMFFASFLLLHKKRTALWKKCCPFHSGLSFHFSELYRVWLESSPPPKSWIVPVKAPSARPQPASKVSCERLIVSVYCNKDTLTLELTLDYTLLIGKNKVF